MTDLPVSAILKAIDESDTLAMRAFISGDLEEARKWRDYSDKMFTKAWNSSEEFKRTIRDKYNYTTQVVDGIGPCAAFEISLPDASRTTQEAQE